MKGQNIPSVLQRNVANLEKIFNIKKVSIH